MPEISSMVWLIPALPLAAFLLVGLFGCVLKGKSHWPVVLASVCSCVLSIVLLLEVNGAIAPLLESNAARGETSTDADNPIGWERTVTLWNWAAVPDAYTPEAAESAAASPQSLDISVTLRTDPLTSAMLVLVTFVGSLVVIYSIGYMHGDPGYARFFAYLGLFIFSMTMLVTSSNFLLLYVFWEAVGVSSYLLIGFWYTKPEAAAAGMKAFLVNRIGDVGLALAVFLIWLNYGTLNFHDVTHTADLADDSSIEVVSTTPGVLGQTRLADPETYTAVGPTVATAIALLLMLAACGKSAQFPLHVWLPDAMEGPTPVSALIHAATMVTAGVYLVTRCSPLFLASPTALYVVASIGAFTALFAGLIALTQNDLKRVLAYSTISQLGYMFLGLGTGLLIGTSAGMFHLLTHGFFKALLFLAAGSVMHAMGGVIDMRRFSGLRRLMPVTHWTFLLGALALAGMAPLSGFWSKDEILTSVAAMAQLGLDEHAVRLYTLLYWSAVFTAFLTAFYTFRAYFMTFHGELEVPSEAGHHAHESPRVMTVPLMILAVGAVVIGGLLASHHEAEPVEVAHAESAEMESAGASHAAPSLEEFLSATPSLAYSGFHEVSPEQHAEIGKIHFEVAGTSVVIALFGIGLAWYLYCGSLRHVEILAKLLTPAYALSYGKFFLDEIYYGLFVWPLKIIADVCAWIDRTLVDGLVDTVGSIPPRVGSLLRWTGAGLIPYYALGMALGLLVLFGVLLAGN